MISQPGKLKIATYILPNVSRSKSNHPNKFGQLIEYNMKNIFPQKPHTKCGGGLFSKISKFNISLDK